MSKANFILLRTSALILRLLSLLPVPEVRKAITTRGNHRDKANITEKILLKDTVRLFGPTCALPCFSNQALPDRKAASMRFPCPVEAYSNNSSLPDRLAACAGGLHPE